MKTNQQDKPITSKDIDDFCDAMGNMMDQDQGEHFLFSEVVKQFGTGPKGKLPKDIPMIPKTGFTLIELLILIAILVIMFGIGAQFLSQQGTSQSGAQQVPQKSNCY